MTTIPTHLHALERQGWSLSSIGKVVGVSLPLLTRIRAGVLPHTAAQEFEHLRALAAIKELQSRVELESVSSGSD
jgi:hypothetical protein